MEPVKPAIASKGVIGSFVAAAMPLLALIGIALSPDEQEQLTNGIVGIFLLISLISSVGGGVVGMIGRWRARKPISGIITSKPLGPEGG